MFLGAGAVFAGATADQTVTYEVTAINEISVSGNPAALTVSTAVAGAEPDEVSDSTTTYAITTNQSKKITGVLDTAMPAGVTLKINLVAPTGGTTVTDVTLLGTATDLVTGISPVAESGKTITYKLSATVAAGVVASANKTVTLTIADSL
ncbi:MAG: hypothetical protein CVV42_12955 [Candidatus Riflebacteria bacterium HGW-Riflebacteria-2]|nr:MAG: hypothetical protein CVV42_12955 [Candidatus Riflebacteria bacterium HGW-Riflebacteria-2]